jgi:hypothetical protein
MIAEYPTSPDGTDWGIYGETPQEQWNGVEFEAYTEDRAPLFQHGYKTIDDACAIEWWLFPANIRNPLAVVDFPDGAYRGPGQTFSDRAHVRRTRTRVLVTQRTGLDI